MKVQKWCFSATSRAKATSLRDFAEGSGPGEKVPVTFIDYQRAIHFSADSFAKLSLS